MGDVDVLRARSEAGDKVRGQTRSSMKVVPPRAGSAWTVYVRSSVARDVQLVGLEAYTLHDLRHFLPVD